METAHANACGEDLKHIKDLMQVLRMFTLALSMQDKEMCGFQHRELGRLLVLATAIKKWDSDTDG
jgi:hypothetical protein